MLNLIHIFWSVSLQYFVSFLAYLLISVQSSALTNSPFLVLIVLDICIFENSFIPIRKSILFFLDSSEIKTSVIQITRFVF